MNKSLSKRLAIVVMTATVGGAALSQDVFAKENKVKVNVDKIVVNNNKEEADKVLENIKKDNKDVNKVEINKKVNCKPYIIAIDKIIRVGESFDPLAGVKAHDLEDGNLTDKIQVIENTVDTSKPGKYSVIYKVTDSNGASDIDSIKVTVLKGIHTDKKNSAPTIIAIDKTIHVGDSFDPLNGVSALDLEDGDLTSKIKVTKNTVDTSKEGTYIVEYSVTDSAGATTIKTINVKVKKKVPNININISGNGNGNTANPSASGKINIPSGSSKIPSGFSNIPSGFSSMPTGFTNTSASNTGYAETLPKTGGLGAVPIIGTALGSILTGVLLKKKRK